MPDPLETLNKVIEDAGRFLPIPGPISAFAFLNTLQALEELPFDAGLRRGAALYGTEPYLTEDRYRDKMARGRIRLEDVAAVLRESLGSGADERIGPSGSRFDLRMAMLKNPWRCGPAEELRWFVAETDALTRMRVEVSLAVRERFIEETRHWVMRDLRSDEGRPAGRALDPADLRSQHLLEDIIERYGASSIEQWNDATWEALALQALWRICRHGTHGIESFFPKPPRVVRHRDVLLEATGKDSDIPVNEMLIRFCAAFADQGLAHWSLPQRELGFYVAFRELYRQPGGSPEPWVKDLARELGRLAHLGLDPLESILESLELLGITDEEWFAFIPATLLALRGWAGMLWQMETRGDRVPQSVPRGTLAEFLAVRLILERVVLAHLAAETLHYTGPLSGLMLAASARLPKQHGPTVEQRAFQVFQLAQMLGWSPPMVARLSRQQWRLLLGEIETFSGIDRRSIFHLAFERRFRRQTLDAIAAHATRQPVRVAAPRFQVSCCLDAREESFRRHLEEMAPDTETFGLPGFYGVAMYYRGAADAHYAALCPIVIKPQHWVVEDVVYSLEDSHRRRALTRRALGTASHQFHVGSRGIAGGALLSAGLGILASIPLMARVLLPRLTARFRKMAGGFVQPPTVTRLRLERPAPVDGRQADQIGYSLGELAAIGERMLRDMGLTSGFARLVVFLGHGSFCLNNPHKSAYDCGACSGSPGGPNARALAAILNDHRVREILWRRGLHVPRDTIFLGGLHNTAVDSITFFDLDLLPKSHVADFESARWTLEQVCKRNAHERCRRFYSAPLNLSFEAAHQHVENRSEDLAQTRPEFGNASNAICIVGRRERTRGLFLDRRAFLASYDPTQDDERWSILGRILAAAVPVCEGINMQYYLSYIDSKGWACGSKLPHNITSLLGVMDGAASDLRPGLPWQGVEIHEPVRLLFVIETTPQAMLAIMDRDPAVGRILRNGWAQLAVLNPDSAEIQIYENGTFEVYQPESGDLPLVPTSLDWYRGWRDHLGFAAIGHPEPAAAAPEAAVATAASDNSESLSASSQSREEPCPTST